MKHLKNISVVLLALALPFTLMSCDKDDDNMDTTPDTTPMDIVEIATSNSDFDSLVVALSTADLVSVFQGDNSGPYTVFAPTNDAFVMLLNDLGVNRISDIDKATLNKVLTYHVLDGSVASTDLSDDMVVRTLSGNTFVVNLDGGTPMINSDASTAANITSVDIEATNGMIHVLDKVILPTMPANAPTDDIVETAVAAGFDSLAVALTQTGLLSMFQGDMTGPYTVFAPTNQAFKDLLAALSVSSISEIDNTTLSAVLQYHVVDGIVASAQLFNNMEIPMLDGNNVMVDRANGAKLKANQTMDVSITTADVWSTNGIVHVIDKVMLP